MDVNQFNNFIQDFFILKLDSIVFEKQECSLVEVQEVSFKSKSNRNYLSISFVANNGIVLNSQSSSDFMNEYEETIEPRLKLDSTVFVNPNNNSPKPEKIYYGTIDWIFNEIYTIIVPYVTVFDENGQTPYDLEAFFSIMCHKQKCFIGTVEVPQAFLPCAQLEAKNIIWEQLEHPIWSTPCHTLHVCDVKECLTCMNGNCESKDLLYLIQLLALLGPKVGLPMRSSAFALAERLVRDKRP